MNSDSPGVDRASCDDDRITAFVDDSMTADELDAFQRHLDDCSRCRDRLERSVAPEAVWAEAAESLSGDWFGSDLSAAASGPVAILDSTDDPTMLGRLAGYEIRGVIGHGGSGWVLKARDTSLDRYVAIKVLHGVSSGGGVIPPDASPRGSVDAAIKQRFVREAQATAAVVHDNVIGIHGVGTFKGWPYLVMPYVKGESLQQRLDREGPASIEDVLRVAIQIARGLAAAHAHGLIHRDVKPANVLMPQNVSRVILTDFGLARAADDDSITHTGLLAGTPQYMSPEQARGETLDGRSDLFSLGSVMYAMLCGRSPFGGSGPYATIRQVIETPHRSVGGHRPETPARLVAVVDRLLEKDRGDRFESADQVADQLQRYLNEIRNAATDTFDATATKRMSSTATATATATADDSEPSPRRSTGKPSSLTTKRIAVSIIAAAALAVAMVAGSFWVQNDPTMLPLDDMTAPGDARSDNPTEPIGVAPKSTGSMSAAPLDSAERIDPAERIDVAAPPDDPLMRRLEQLEREIESLRNDLQLSTPEFPIPLPPIAPEKTQ